MSKPKWEDAPEWARFVALDSDGEWYWFEGRPSVGINIWKKAKGNGRVAFAGSELDWRESLEPRP